MSETGELAAWVSSALAKVSGDVDRAREIVADAVGQLFKTFEDLRVHLAEERHTYEAAVQAITGSAGDQGLVRVVNQILERFVEDIVNISRSSVRILLELDGLRSHADEVAGRGNRIEKIAHATRVISLNAAIEASRVGSAGGVFRVVANEIKVLAGETSELSQAIRAAIARQAACIAKTQEAASQLAATDLETAVAGHKAFGVTIARLEEVSATSTRALEKIQVDVDVAIRALQFEDMLTQLLASISGKLGAIRGVCAEAAAGGYHRTGSLRAALATIDDQIRRDSVAQHSVATGDVELF